LTRSIREKGSVVRECDRRSGGDLASTLMIIITLLLVH